MIVVSLTASAQFTVYQPVEVPRTTYPPSPGYGTPFTIYEPVYGNPYQQMQQAKPKMQEVTLRGYYKKGNDWYSMIKGTVLLIIFQTTKLSDRIMIRTVLVI